MTRGRCAGCGYENASCKKVRTHTSSCPQFFRLWKENPDAALDPEVEYVRNKEHQGTDEALTAKEEAKEAVRQGHRDAAAVRIEAAKERWLQNRSEGLGGPPPHGIPTPAPDDVKIGKLDRQCVNKADHVLTRAHDEGTWQ